VPNLTLERVKKGSTTDELRKGLEKIGR